MSSIQSKQSADFPNIVVLGASGRLARLIRPFWENMPVRWQSRTPLNGCARVDILNDPDGLKAMLVGADCVICFAGVTPAPDACFDDNVSLARACLNAASNAHAGHVLLTSSAAVYGADDGDLSEAADVHPISDYGRAKHQMEQMATLHSHPSTCLRIGNVVGADAAVGGWQPGAVMDQFPDGSTPTRSYIGPATLARALLRLATTPALPKILNLAAPGSLEMGALLTAADRPFSYRPAGPQTLANVTLDTRLLETFVPFSAQDSDPAQMVREWKEAITL